MAPDNRDQDRNKRKLAPEEDARRKVAGARSVGADSDAQAKAASAGKSQAGQKRPASSKALRDSAKKLALEETVVFDDNTAKKIGDGASALEKTQTVPAQKGKRRISNLFKPREKKPNFVLSIALTTIQMALVAVVIVVAVVAGSVVGVANAYMETAPELDTDRLETQQLSSKIYDPEGNLLATYTGKENREWASIEEIPEELQNAVIAVEDIRFYEHNGVDYRRLMGAFVSNVTTATSEGGSTITQQLVKNKLLSNERSYKRKLQEAYLSMELEKKYDKEQILESYLNTIPLGGRVYGVKTAARDYFGKSLSQLTLKEMICIASITQRPHQYNPRRATYGEGDLVGLINRMNIIAERMLWSDMITQEQYDEVYTPSSEYRLDDELNPNYLAKWRAEMNILEKSPTNELYKYPHFVEYVIYDVQTFMLNQQGLEDTDENRELVDQEMRSKGYSIYTTVKGDVQDAVQQTLSEWEDYPRFKDPENMYVYEEDGSGNIVEIVQPQASAVVIDNDTGHILALIGSRDEPTSASTFNRAYQSTIQVGSSIKPIAVYGPAFELGYGPGAPVANIDVPINGWYNSEGELSGPRITGTQGAVTMRQAIVGSWNVAAARTLMDYVSIPTSMKYLERLGVDTQRIEETGTDTPSGLSMGAAPITPLEMAGAYSAIARGGEYLQPISFTKVLDSEGNTVIDAEAERETHEAFKASTAYMLTDVLVQAVNEGTGKNAKIPDMTTAGKTGTVADNLGTFFAGYTPHYTSALWMGHDESISFGDGTFASSSTAPLWKAYMTKIHEGLPDGQIIPGEPEDYGIIVDATVCKYSGMAPSGSCETVSGWFVNPPTAVCDTCSYGGGQTICSVSGKLWIEGYCPIEAQTTKRVYNFPASSPYASWNSGTVTEYCDVHLLVPIAPADPATAVNQPVVEQAPAEGVPAQ